MLRQERSSVVILKGEACTMWMRWLKRVTLCLLMGHPIIKCGCGIVVLVILHWGIWNVFFRSLNNCNAPLDCEACVLAKIHKHTYFPSLTHSIKPFALIHSDVWGLAPESNTHGLSYFILFVDDCTRMSWVYFLKHKSEVFDVFVKLYNILITQFQAQPQILRSDNGGKT